jgi:hypothetical protein
MPRAMPTTAPTAMAAPTLTARIYAGPAQRAGSALPLNAARSQVCSCWGARAAVAACARRRLLKCSGADQNGRFGEYGSALPAIRSTSSSTEP